MPPSPSPHRGDAREIQRQQGFIDTVLFNYLDGLLQAEEEMIPSRCLPSSLRQCFLAGVCLPLYSHPCLLFFRAFSGNSIPWACTTASTIELPNHVCPSCLGLNSEAHEGQDLCHNNIEPYFLLNPKIEKQGAQSFQLPSTTISWSGLAFILEIPRI